MIIPVGTAASGLDIFLRYNNVLTDPISITYQIFEPGDTIVGSGSGFRRSTGHYDARNSVIPSGFDISNPWKIEWTFTSPANVTSTACENFIVVSELVPAFSNIDNIIEQLKLDLGLRDTDFTQSQLETFIIKALNKINRSLCLAGTDQELHLDETTGTITPPINSAGLDLILMSVECLIVRRDRRVAISKGIRVRDGDSEIDTTAGFVGQRELSQDLCNDYEKAIAQLLYNGCAITEGGMDRIPGDLIWYGNSRIYADMDHDGQGSGQTRDFSSPFDSSGMSFTIPNRGC